MDIYEKTVNMYSMGRFFMRHGHLVLNHCPLHKIPPGIHTISLGLSVGTCSISSVFMVVANFSLLDLQLILITKLKIKITLNLFDIIYLRFYSIFEAKSS